MLLSRLMKMNKIYYSTALLMAMLTSFPHAAYAGIVLGNTRVIYPSDAKEVILPLKNTESDTTYLIQSTIENEAGEKQQNFVLTPPLFVLKPNGENKLRLFMKTQATLSPERESLFWLSIKSIPSSEKKTEGSFVQFSITNKIKLIYRPLEIGSPDEQSYKKLRIFSEGETLMMHNQTPFYMNIASISSGGLDVSSITLSPEKTQVLGQKKNTTDNAEVNFINDFGGEVKVTIPVM